MNLRRAAAASAFFALCASAQAYYHFVHYTPATSGYQRIPEKFNLSALVNNTVTYVIAAGGPEKLAAGDSFTSLVSQIHLAARTWSTAVPTSQLRLAFGGFVQPGAATVAPEIEIVFDDLPPGVLGYGAPTVRGDVTGTEAARFLPIVKSTVILPKDFSAQPNRAEAPSWSEALFLTITHEMGHALGLQHSQAASVMSTQLTRSVTKASPLTDDDRAGLSTLYPTPEFAARLGSITGRVTAGADGINLASVVALTPDGDALQTLTDPDGTYRLDGLAPGNYFLYVHPLPPPVGTQANPDDVIPPSAINGTVFPHSGLFSAQFFPGVQRTDQASLVTVKSAETTANIDFRVIRRDSIPVYAVQTYSFPGVAAVKPAHLSPAYARNLMVVSGTGLVTVNGVAPGLNVDSLSTSVAVSSLQPYAPAASFLQINTQLHPFPGQGPRHMIFSRDGALHLSPSAVRLVGQNPPVVTEWAEATDDSGASFIDVRGSGFNETSRVFFDGVAAVVAARSATVLRLRPPSAPTGHKASIVVLNGDGQSSLFLTGQAQSFPYGDAPDAGISLSPAALVPGVETFVDIAGSGTAFDASTTIAFGTADLIVRRQWVLSPQRIVANVITLPGAAPGARSLVVTQGLRQLQLPQGVQIADAPSRVVSVASAIVDDATGRSAISPNFTARVRLAGVDPNLRAPSVTVTVAGVAAPVVSFTDSVLVFRMPPTLGPGPAITEITAGAEALPKVLVAVDLPPPVIVNQASNLAATSVASAGDVVTLRVLGLTERNEPAAAARLRVTLNGIPVRVVQSAVAEPGPGHDIAFEIDPKQAAGTFPLIVSIDGRASAPIDFTVR